MKAGNDMYALPFAYVGMAEIGVAEKNAKAGTAYIKKAKTYSNYEFEAFLSWRVRKCEDDIKNLK